MFRRPERQAIPLVTTEARMKSYIDPREWRTWSRTLTCRSNVPSLKAHGGDNLRVRVPEQVEHPDGVAGDKRFKLEFCVC